MEFVEILPNHPDTLHFHESRKHSWHCECKSDFAYTVLAETYDTKVPNKLEARPESENVFSIQR